MRTVRLFGLLLLVIAPWLFLPLTAKATPTLTTIQNPPGPAEILLSTSSSRLVGPDEVPSGLEAGEWQAIKKQMVLHRHRVQPASGDVYQAINPAQQFQANFAEGGMQIQPWEGSWKWGLRLVRYGSVEVTGQPRQVWAENNRVYYRWDGSLTEWYENGERGLEQGFTLKERPPGLKDGQPLALTLVTQGGLSPKVDPGGQQVSFRDREGRVRLTYGELAVIDAGGTRVPARLERAGSRVKIVVDDRQAVYPLTIDPLVQQAYLKASNTGADDSFGRSVAISGDTVVVGAYGETSNATGVNGNQGDNSAVSAGAAYVFVRTNGVWVQQAYLKASNTGVGDYFGLSVAISGDTVVVGAYGEDSNATGVNGNEGDNSALYAGAVYVFVRTGGVWVQQAYLKASNTGAGDNFGYSVAISGDTVVVGADGEDSNATGVNGIQGDNSAANAGAAYVFIRTSGVWVQQAYLKASNTGTGDYFGLSVAISGDTVVVGASEETSNSTGVNGNQADNSAVSAGAAYVFVRTSGVWVQQAYLKASNTGARDLFGWSVAISGDTVVVGASYEASNATGVNGNQLDNSTADAGAVYVFVRTNGVWVQQAYLKASNTGAGDNFGYSVAISGDTVVVGAYAETSNATGVNGNQGDNSAFNAGAVYVFVRSSGVWVQQAYLKASNTGAGDLFGSSVAVSGDLVVVGARNEASNATGVNGNQGDNSAVSAGAAYVFNSIKNYLPIILKSY